jgi:molybdopterin-guanine dinucleotide biosynthesis protein A
MGVDKALLSFRGETLAAAVARAVEQAAGTVLLVGDPIRYERLGFAVIPDLYPGEGPLGGILTALAHTGAEWNLITACDMPELRAGFLGRLFEIAEGSEADAVLARGPSGIPEPLCAVYRRTALDSLQTAFHRGIRKITAALASVPVAYLEVADLKPLQNVNTPEEWSGYASG